MQKMKGKCVKLTVTAGINGPVRYVTLQPPPANIDGKVCADSQASILPTRNKIPTTSSTMLPTNMIEWSSEAHLNLETVAHLTAHLGLNFFYSILMPLFILFYYFLTLLSMVNIVTIRGRIDDTHHYTV
jgi:hypothetical protein